jgi:predicted amidohydrolase
MPKATTGYSRALRDGSFRQRAKEYRSNNQTTRRVIAEALERGSHFSALPETFLSGYDSPEHMRAGARKIDVPQLAEFIRESSKHEMVIIVGLARQAGEGIYNSVLVIHGGKPPGTYDKIMLTGGDRENLQFLPGTEMPVFTAHGAGRPTCWKQMGINNLPDNTGV